MLAVDGRNADVRKHLRILQLPTVRRSVRDGDRLLQCVLQSAEHNDNGRALVNREEVRPAGKMDVAAIYHPHPSSPLANSLALNYPAPLRLS